MALACAIALAGGGVAQQAASEPAPEHVPVEHPRAAALVHELVTSDDPRVQFWAWKHLSYLADGALPALQPLLSHRDPMRQWKALELVRAYREKAPERIPAALQVPEVLTFPPDRLLDAVFMIAETSAHSLVVEDGALADITDPLVVKVNPSDPWKDLVAWAEAVEGLHTAWRGGVLVLYRHHAPAAALVHPTQTTGPAVYSRVMHHVAAADGLRVIQSLPSGYGLVVLPGAWKAERRFSYLLCAAPWEAAVETMACASGLSVRWIGEVLLVSGSDDQVPAGLEEMDFAGLVPAPADPEEKVPTLSRYDNLASSPLLVISEVAARAGLSTVVLPATRDHVAALPQAVRIGYENGEPRPWLHARFNGMPALQAAHLLAAVLRLEAEVRGTQFQLTVKQDE